MGSLSQDFASRKFFEFYSNPSTIILAPESIDQREFAFFLFKERIMIRHKSATSVYGLRRLLCDNKPSDVYHSCAYYENPEANMGKKGWLGADLVFDIDADHIPTGCDKIHDEWICLKCGFSGRGISPEKCPLCEGQKFDAKTWPCERCINSAREETAKLIEMLGRDFGLSEGEVRVFFSGHRGYHVHVNSSTIKTLDTIARKEIVDYVLGLGLTAFEDSEVEKRRRRSGLEVFNLRDSGWDKRIKLGMKRFILTATQEDLKNVGIKRVDPILQNRELIANRYIEENRWTSVKGVGALTWKKIARHVRESLAANIDTVVTTDIHRLIRMNGTLHGKTGLKKVELPVGHLATFDPFIEAVAFKEGTAKVSVFGAPQFRIGENTLGPYKNEIVELPMAAAILLILKGRAQTVAD